MSSCRDQRLYKQAVSPSVQPPEPLTPDGKLRYADGILDASRQRIITVQEDHSGSGEAVNTIAAVCKEALTLQTHPGKLFGPWHASGNACHESVDWTASQLIVPSAVLSALVPDTWHLQVVY